MSAEPQDAGEAALELARRARRIAGDDALALVTRERSLLLRFAANRPTQATAIDDTSVELAVACRGYVGRASTNALDDASLERCARRAHGAADVAAATGRGGFPGFAPESPPGSHARGPHAPAGASAPSPPAGFDPATAQLDPRAGAAELERAFAVARASGVEAHGIWTAAEQRRAWAGAAGAGREQTTDAFMKVICIALDGRSGYAAEAARAAGQLDGAALAVEASARTGAVAGAAEAQPEADAPWALAVARAAAGGAPAELAPGEYDVVFDADAVGCLLDLLAGSAFDGLAHVEGRGALSERLGSQVAAPAINLADTPRHPLTLPHSFDAEGTAKRPLPLIEDGVARRVAHDLRSAALAGEPSTGHALTPGGGPHGALPTNLVLAGGGAAGLAELCAPVDRGIYITRLWYANVIRPKETLATAVTRDGTFLIEGGKLRRPLRDLRLTDRVLGVLARVQALGREQKLASDGEFYGRRFAYGVVCPALRAERVRFTGAAG